MEFYYFFAVLKTLIFLRDDFRFILQMIGNIYSYGFLSFATTTHFGQESRTIQIFKILDAVDDEVTPSYFVKLHHANCLLGFNAESVEADQLVNHFRIRRCSIRRPTETAIASSLIYEMLFNHVFDENGQPRRPPLTQVTLREIFGHVHVYRVKKLLQHILYKLGYKYFVPRREWILGLLENRQDSSIFLNILNYRPPTQNTRVPVGRSRRLARTYRGLIKACFFRWLRPKMTELFRH